MTSMLTRLDLVLTTSSCACTSNANSRSKNQPQICADLRSFISTSSHAQRIRHAIDVVEPRRDERNLQNSLVIKTHRAQAVVIGRRDTRCVTSYLHHVIEHNPLLFGDRR